MTRLRTLDQPSHRSAPPALSLAYKKTLRLLAAAGGATALVNMAYPLLAKAVVDDVQSNGTEASFALWVAADVAGNVVFALGSATFVWMAGKVDAFVATTSAATHSPICSGWRSRSTTTAR